MTKNKKSLWLIIGAVGIVFGDIGTSPLYALQAIFTLSHLDFSIAVITGVLSIIIWTITLVVTIKYVGLMLRANNNGEGGIMALLALIKQTSIPQHTKMTFTILALIGIALFYGDSVITPAISVLSAVEGIELLSPALSPAIVPLTVLILIGLFLLQARGSENIGKLFGPIMILWFIVAGIGGILGIIQYPPILTALSPFEAMTFLVAHPIQAFFAMGAVILTITGAEALYADMGHFGTSAIRKGWLFLVFPALVINYLGQGALVVTQPDAIVSSFYLLFPSPLQLPIIILATTATLIASQAVISGAFSLTNQAIQLGFAPRLTIKHTSRRAFGQIYVPTINWIIAVLVVWTVVLFGSSAQLTGAYGMAVSGTLAIDTILLLVVIRHVWKRSLLFTATVGVVFLTIDLLFISSSASKLLHGAWLPLTIAVISYTLLTTWYRGHGIISRERERREGTLRAFVRQARHKDIPRIPGYAVYLGHHLGNAPLALHETLEQLHEIHENVIVVTVQTSDQPHITEHSRARFDNLGHSDDGISHIALLFGYMDTPNIPRALENAQESNKEVEFDPWKATYFTSISQPVIVQNHRMSHWRKKLYLFMDRNADNASAYYRLPLDKSIEMRTFLEL